VIQVGAQRYRASESSVLVEALGEKHVVQRDVDSLSA